MYLVTNTAAKKISGIKIELSNKIGGLESLLRSLSREIDLKKVEPGRFNTDLGL